VNEAAHYIGRFAPSPTGALHFGSVITALGSYLCARSVNGEWLLRIDDIDPPREKPGAADAILRTLERLGLIWDRSVFYQRHRQAIHREACALLVAHRLAYRCACSRKTIGDRAYPGTCRDLNLGIERRHVIRIRVPTAVVSVLDALQGIHTLDLALVGGDFVIWRVEDLPSYHLACVLDDDDLGVTEVVRGADLLDSTPQQYFLQTVLGLKHPSYAHLPVAVDATGRKLSKQTEAASVARLPPHEVLARALAFLGHPLPHALSGAPAREILAWACVNWARSRLPQGMSRRLT
jgi:glutamyl-Q tRNA(Asp) synthetase